MENKHIFCEDCLYEPNWKSKRHDMFGYCKKIKQHIIIGVWYGIGNNMEPYIIPTIVVKDLTFHIKYFRHGCTIKKGVL